MSVFQGKGRRGAARTRGVDDSALSRDRIVDTALKLIDAQGLEAFSLRAVAKELGVYPTALYWHVPSRNELVVEIISDVLADIVPPQELPWEDWIRALLHRYRAVIRRHPNVAPLIGVQLVSNASADLGMIERILAKLHEAGFEGARLVAAYNALLGTMVGFVTQEFAMVLTDDTEQWMDRMSRIISTIDPERYPLLAAHRDQMINRSFILRWENGATAPLDGGFEFYCELLVAGLKALARPGPEAQSRSGAPSGK
ncbi:TetR/AcrR family tetracycline transcriptional repressor [Amorphus suaedae]|mgnify:CR=1 FL=1